MHLQFLTALLLLTPLSLASNNFYGIDISSFNSNGQCRSAGPWANISTLTTTETDLLCPSAQWDSIVANAKNNGYKRFRIYGNDCGVFLQSSLPARVRTNVFGLGTTFDYATAAAKKYGLPVLIGIWVGKFSLAVSQTFRLPTRKKTQMGRSPTLLPA